MTSCCWNTIKWILRSIFYILFWPIIMIGMLVPIAAILNNILISFFLFCYKSIFKHREEYKINPRQFWSGPVTLVARLLRFHGQLWHGYEMRGLDNIPDEKATILVLYHAQIPIDAPYVLSKILLEKKRKPITIVDRLVYNIPGYRTFLEAFEQQSGTVEGCLEYMKNNEMLAIYPGGTREGCLAGDNYEIIWPERAGFAKIAHQTKPVIIPIFTQNCRNVFAVIHLLKACCRRLYLRKKFSYTPLCGWFPVKLISHVGAAIEYDESNSIEEIVEMTKESMRNLIDTHQRIPGSIWQAFFDRFRKNP